MTTLKSKSPKPAGKTGGSKAGEYSRKVSIKGGKGKGNKQINSVKPYKQQQ